jgi:hypothetical protein
MEDTDAVGSLMSRSCALADRPDSLGGGSGGGPSRTHAHYGGLCCRCASQSAGASAVPAPALGSPLGALARATGGAGSPLLWRGADVPAPALRGILASGAGAPWAPAGTLAPEAAGTGPCLWRGDGRTPGGLAGIRCEPSPPHSPSAPASHSSSGASCWPQDVNRGRGNARWSDLRCRPNQWPHSQPGCQGRGGGSCSRAPPTPGERGCRRACGRGLRPWFHPASPKLAMSPQDDVASFGQTRVLPALGAEGGSVDGCPESSRVASIIPPHV